MTTTPFADDLAAVIDSCGLDRANLVGFSMGGGEIARYLSRHGAAKVSRAVLIGAVVPICSRPTTIRTVRTPACSKA
jgi:non-heme chloroperoxidase